MIVQFKKFLYYITFTIFFFSCVKQPTSNNNGNSSTLNEKSIENVSYGAHSRQVYDIFLPAGRDSNTPVVVMLHGGAWKAGQKEDINVYVQLLKAKWKNVAIVNMNYRWASNANNIHHNEIMQDIKSVISDIIQKKDSYKISSKMGLMGVSAGGQLAMIYSYAYNDFNNIACVGNIFGPSLIRDWSWYNSNNIWLGVYVGDVLAEYVGVPWDTTVYKNVSPYYRINNTSAPTILFHGNLDPIVPVYQSQWMNAQLNNVGVAHQYHEYIAFHGFDANQNDDVMNKMVNFFKLYLKP